MTTLEKIKNQISGEIITETELDNIMCRYGFLPSDSDDDTIIKYHNGKSQIWIDVCRDEYGNVLPDNVRQATKEKGETEVDPIHSFEDLKRILDRFYNNKKYHHWLCAMLQTLLGRRVGDICGLKWSEFYTRDGNFRERLKTLKEEKTGKIVGLYLTDYVKEVIEDYCNKIGVNPTENLNDKIFPMEAQSFRKAFKKVVSELDIRYDISCHSFRKFFGNQSYKLHPNDPDRIKIIQYLFGHSSDEITRHYIGEIDERMDKYMKDMSEATKAYLENGNYEIDNSPIVSLRAQDLRQIVSEIYFEGKKSAAQPISDVEKINALITEIEKIRIA